MTEAGHEVPLGMRELQPNAGKYVAECLREHGVEVAFGVHGGHIWQILDEMSYAGIRIVTVRHEQAGVYAAEAYSKATGKPGVAFATAGPGMSNCVSAVQQAFLSNSPIVLLFGSHPPVNDKELPTQEAYAENLMGSITKWTKRLQTPEAYKHFITRAFKDAQTFPKGPVALEFTTPSLFSALRGPIPPVVPQGANGPHSTYVENWRGSDTGKPIPAGGAPESVEKAVKLIYSARMPVIFAADGVHWSEGSKSLIEFAELAQVPVVTRRIARGAIPEVHPLYVNARAARKMKSNCDLIVALGMKICDNDEYGMGWPATIQINESAEHIWTYIKTAATVVGDPGVVLKQMIDYVKRAGLTPPPGRAEGVKKLQDSQKALDERLQAKANKFKRHEPVHPGYLAKLLWETAEALYGGMNRVIIDGFTMSEYAMSFIKARYSGQIMDSSEQAGVGHGIGMAIGAAFADPRTKRCPVIALMGDGGMGVGGMDIETAMRYQLPIVYLVTNNNGWLTAMKYMAYGEKWEALGHQDRGQGPECIKDIRYDKMFEVLGCHGEWVTSPSQIQPSLERAFRAAESGKTAVVNVQVDPRVGNQFIYTPGFAIAFAHIPWDKLPKTGRAQRRNLLTMFPWDKVGVPPMPAPDPWDPME